jgi:diacylglycerol kinase family enzyme
MTERLQSELRRYFADHLFVDFDPALDVGAIGTEDASVVVAGGDGTVGHVARQLIDTPRPLGILSLGTFNNFARALGVPQNLDQATELARSGKPRPVRIGRVKGRPFLEAAAIGIFGEAIETGEDIKELRFGELGMHLRRLLGARPFRYRLSGDIVEEGTALSLVFANTPTSGAAMPIGEGAPTDPYLQLSKHVGETRRDLVRRVTDSALLHKHEEHAEIRRFRRLTVETEPLELVRPTDRAVHVYGDATELGQTPARIEAELGGLHVRLPAPL